MTSDEHMIPAMVELAGRLLAQTQKEKITWSPTDREGTFIFSSKDSSVMIGKKADAKGHEYTELLLLNGQGNEVGRLDNQHSDQVEVVYAESLMRPSGQYDELLDDLFNNARRSALSINVALKDMLTALGDEESDESS